MLSCVIRCQGTDYAASVCNKRMLKADDYANIGPYCMCLAHSGWELLSLILMMTHSVALSYGSDVFDWLRHYMNFSW